MDFGVLGLDGFVGPESATGGGNGEGSKIVVGSGFAKHEKPSESVQEELRGSKIPRTDDFSVPRAMPLHQHGSSSLLRSNSMIDYRQHENMLSFSSLEPEVTSFLSKDGVLIDKTAQYYQHSPSAYIAGYGTGNTNGSLHGPFNGVRGPFTPSQWMELEHQALIYKYLTAKVPVPSNLLIPIKKSFYPYALSASSAGPFPPNNTLGWSTFHLGYPGNTTDPEPGRCRRTDGKKWRCSRDAVADQKYCERHINRGRHRSRKPVEGQTGHAATGTTNSKVVPMTTSVSTSVITSGAASNSLAIMPQQFKNVQPAAANSFTIVNKAQDPRGLSMMSSTVNLKPEDSTFSISKQEIPIEESSQLEFGLVPSDSLLNPSQRTTYLSSKNYESFLSFSDQESQDQHSLRQYSDDWPKDQSNRSVISWPGELKSDWTQLSMSIPMTSEFSSSTSSPTWDKVALSPLRLSREFDTSRMGLGVHNNPSEFSHKQANWIPISWGNPMGGPLGEVLTTSAGNAGNCNKNTSSLSLLTEGYEGSPQLGSSPTGVLQKATFGSLSNSSSGSSPRTEIKNTDGVNLRDDVLGSMIEQLGRIQSSELLIFSGEESKLDIPISIILYEETEEILADVKEIHGNVSSTRCPESGPNPKREKEVISSLPRVTAASSKCQIPILSYQTSFH